MQCPSWISITPNFCKILPSEKLKFRFKFRPSPGTGLDYKDRVLLRCIETPQVQIGVTVQGQLTDAPLKLSEQRISFVGIAIGDEVSSRVEIHHSNPQGNTEYSFRIMSDHVTPVKQSKITECLDFQLKLAPGCGICHPGQRVGLAMKISPMLKPEAVQTKLDELQADFLKEKKQHLLDEIEKERIRSHEASERNSADSKNSGKGKARKGSPKKLRKASSKTSADIEQALLQKRDAVELGEFTLSDDEISSLKLKAKRFLLDELDFGEKTEFKVPIVVAKGRCIDPTADILSASEIVHLPAASLYLMLQISVKKPLVVVEKKMDFGKVVIGSKHIRTILCEKLDKDRNIGFKLSTIDPHGTFTLYKCLRDLPADDPVTKTSVSILMDSTASNKPSVIHEEAQLQVFDTSTKKLLHRINLNILAQTTRPQIGFLQKLPGNQHSLSCNTASRSNVSVSRKSGSEASSRSSSRSDIARGYDKFLTSVVEDNKHIINLGTISAKTAVIKTFEMKNMSDVAVDLVFEVVPMSNSDLQPDGKSSIFDILPKRKMSMEPGQFVLITLQAFSEQLEGYHAAKVSIFLDNFSNNLSHATLLHEILIEAHVTALPVYLFNPIDASHSFVRLNGAKNLGVTDQMQRADTESSPIVLSTHLSFYREVKERTISLGMLTKEIKNVEFTIDDSNTIERLGFEILNETSKVLVEIDEEKELTIKWTPKLVIDQDSLTEAISANTISWVDVGRTMKTSFKISANVASQCFVWNIYLSCILEN